MLKKMNRVEGERGYWRMVTDDLFLLERLLLLLIVFFPAYVFNVIFSVVLFTSFVALPFFLFCPKLSSVGPSGIGGFWLFLVDRLTFYLGFEYFKLLAGGFEFPFLWRLAVCLSLVVHSIYTVDYLRRYYRSVPPSTPGCQNDDTSSSTGDVTKKVGETKELVKMMRDVEHMIHSLKKEWEQFSEEGRKMMMTKADAMEHVICSRFATIRDNVRVNFDELRSKVEEDIKSSRQDFNKDLKSVAELLHETYLVIQESAKEAKTRADKAFQEDQSKRRTIRGEDVEGFTELKEEVRRLWMDLSATRGEAVELVEAGFQQWEEDNAEYLASLPHLYCNHS